jgi:hypothetical protein
MRIKEPNVIRIVVGIIGFLCSQVTFAQVLQEPKVVNEGKFIKAMRANVSRIFSTNPYGNIDSVKYEGYYAILRISDGKVIEIVYPCWIEPLVTRLSGFAMEDFNERISSGEFEFQNIDQIIIPAISEWIHFETSEPQLHKALLKILPKIGYTPNTFVLAPYLLPRGNPLIN